MKKMLQWALVCAGIGFFTASCSSEYDATPEIPGKDSIKNTMRGDFTADVDGVSFVADAKVAEDHTTDGVRTVSVSGIMYSFNKDPENYTAITLSISNYEGPKTYPLQWGTTGMYLVQTDSTSDIFLGKNGDTTSYITITNDQDKLEGSFNLIVAPNGTGNDNNHYISNGSFSVPK